MKCVIDARYIRERPSGIGAYVKALMDFLPLLSSHDQFEFWVQKKIGQENSRLIQTQVKIEPNGLRTLFFHGKLAPLSGANLFHAPFNILGRGVSCPVVTTIHDLMWIVAPELCEFHSSKTYYDLQKKFYINGIERAIQQSRKIIAISQATADDIVRIFPKAQSKIKVIYHGLNPLFKPQEKELEEEEFFKKFGFRGKYFLVVGQNAPYKNHEAILRAFLKRKNRHVKLVFVQRLFKKTKPHEDVLFLEAIPEVDLVFLMQHASALIQFSRFEGLGMPVVEAMACGVPVIASDIPVLKEVSGGAAVHVPFLESSLTEAMDQMIEDDSFRENLIQKGLKRSRDFSWERCALEHLSIYHEALAEVR